MRAARSRLLAVSVLGVLVPGLAEAVRCPGRVNGLYFTQTLGFDQERISRVTEGDSFYGHIQYECVGDCDPLVCRCFAVDVTTEPSLEDDDGLPSFVRVCRGGLGDNTFELVAPNVTEELTLTVRAELSEGAAETEITVVPVRLDALSVDPDRVAGGQPVSATVSLDEPVGEPETVGISTSAPSVVEPP